MVRAAGGSAVAVTRSTRGMFVKPFIENCLRLLEDPDKETGKRAG